MKACNPILTSRGDTIFDEMSRMAEAHNAINLGQGAPDDPGPRALLEAAATATLEGSNQYPPMRGTPALRQAIADHDRRFYGLTYDPNREILVTAGATEAIASALFALLSPGDEAIILEPAYDCYEPIIELAGAKVVRVALRAPDWSLPLDALRAAFSDKTKLIVLNTPHNPTGKVFDNSELAAIAALVEKYDTYAVCDEVYEHLVFDGRTHTPLAAIENMRGRCLRIGSAGKTFSVTGWKIGYVCGPEPLITPVLKAHQFFSFTQPPNLQHAVSVGLAMDDAFYRTLSDTMQARRDVLASGLQEIGFALSQSQGTYFITADIRDLGHTGSDRDFCIDLTQRAGVAAIPVSAFVNDPQDAYMVRFCFAKGEGTLNAALQRLRTYFAP